MHSSKDHFRDEIKPGHVLDGLLDDGLVQYAVGTEGLKLELTAEGNAFFSTRTRDPAPRAKFRWYHIAIAIFFLFLIFYYGKS